VSQCDRQGCPNTPIYAQRGIEWTYPAVLSGLGNYLATIDLLTRFSVNEIFKLKDELEDIIGFKM